MCAVLRIAGRSSDLLLLVFGCAAGAREEAFGPDLSPVPRRALILYVNISRACFKMSPVPRHRAPVEDEAESRREFRSLSHSLSSIGMGGGDGGGSSGGAESLTMGFEDGAVRAFCDHAVARLSKCS